MPPSLREWLPADHLAWFVIECADRLDLEAFYAAYRVDGHLPPTHLDECLLAGRERELTQRGTLLVVAGNGLLAESLPRPQLGLRVEPKDARGAL